MLETLAEMGCYRIWIGSESGSQRILDAMERGVTAEQVQWATKAAQRHGIEVGMFLMWGYEGETIDDIEATIEHVKKANPDIFFTTVAYPIKGTGYYHEGRRTAWCATKAWDDGHRPRLRDPRPPLARLLQAGRPLAARRGRRVPHGGRGPGRRRDAKGEALAAREAMLGLAGEAEA